MEEKFKNRLTQAHVDIVEETIQTRGVVHTVLSANAFITTAYARMMTWRTKEVMNTTKEARARPITKD